MIQSNEKKSMQVNENQLMQMAKQEEAELTKKKAVLERVSSALSETIMAKETLKELKHAKGKMLVNIGASVLIEVNAEPTKKCKRGFATNGYKNESIEDTITWLTTREEQIKKQYEQIQKEATISNFRLNDMIGILRQIEAEKRKMASATPPRLSK